MDVRDPYSGSAYGLTRVDGARIVTVCAELRDVEPMAQALEKLNSGTLFAYDRPADLRHNPPVGEIDLFVLIDREFLESAADTLEWLDRYWPHAARAVVGSGGSGRQEIAARIGGAMYFADPVLGGQWRSLVHLAVQRANRANASAA